MKKQIYKKKKKGSEERLHCGNLCGFVSTVSVFVLFFVLSVFLFLLLLLFGKKFDFYKRQTFIYFMITRPHFGDGWLHFGVSNLYVVLVQ